MTTHESGRRLAAVGADEVGSKARAEARLILSWSRRELNSRYRQSALSVLWSLIQPLSVIAVYAVVFTQILRVDGDGLPYVSFMMTGLVIWRFFVAGLSQANSIIDHSAVINRIAFRKEIVPLSGVASAMVELVIGLVAVVAIASLQGIRPSMALVALPAVLLPLLFITAGVAVLIATVTVFVRDLGHAMPTLVQLFFLATPIMYSANQIPDELQFLRTANPIAIIVERSRDVVLRQEWPNAWRLAATAVLSFGFFVAALAYARSIEHRMVDVL